MRHSARAFAIVSVLFAASCAGGGRSPDGGPPAAPIQIVTPDAPIFLEFDADRDRRITRAEADRGIAAAWTEAAKDGASIGYLEWRDWLVKVIGSDQFDVGPVGFDTDADLRITRAEFTAALQRRFAALDANSDGAIDRGELVKRMTVRTPPEGFGGPGPGGQGGASGGGQGGGPPGGGR